MKSLEDLKKMRESAQERVRLRESKGGTRIVVAMGTCGIAAGARETLAAIMDELQKRGLNDVTVTQTGCIGLCEKEPIVEVIKPDQPQVMYGYVSPERARQIIARHVVNDQVTGEWVISAR
ncbi:MAG: (2Fe-2S) ferredoxin domain-containing protein [Bacillota bacterium]